MDLGAISDAIAARFSGITTSTGETAAVSGLVDTVGMAPVILVYPPTGVLDIGLNRTIEDEYDFPVLLLRDPFTVPERHAALLRWANAMRLRVEGDMDLSLSYVRRARAIGIRIELDGERYGDAVLDVVELTVRVSIYEPGAAVNP